MTIIQRLLLIAMALVPSAVFGANLLQVDSKYLGGGQFEYRVKSLPDSLFLALDVTSFGIPFAGRVAYGPVPPKWMADTSSVDRAEWVYDSFDAQPREQEITFTARSTQTTFKTVTARMLGYSFTFNNGQAGSENVDAVGVAEFSILVPCPPSEADNSPTNRVSGFEALPPLRLRKLEMSGGNVNGVTFSWVGDFTVRLQTSANLRNWQDVAYLFGSGSANTWTTNQPLNSFGNFFRLQLVGQGHIPQE
jgi:hypothetical protein